MKYAILLVSLMVGAEVAAQAPSDHLVPEDGTFAPNDSSYDLEVARQLLPRLSFEADFAVIVMPSFSPEWSVSVNAVAGTIAVARAPQSISHNQGKDVVKPIEKSTKIPVALARRIVALVTAHLDRVRYPAEPNIGADGTYYHFVQQRRGVGIRAGQIWSPHSGAVASLVEVIEILGQPSLSNAASLNDLERAVANAERSLSKK